jgi:hypothetical protein
MRQMAARQKRQLEELDKLQTSLDALKRRSVRLPLRFGLLEVLGHRGLL